MNKHTLLTPAIKAEAYRLGFHLVGVTTPDPPAHLDVYIRWLEREYHAGMDWMATSRARERRADPLKILPECKSILVLGIRHNPPTPHLTTHQGRQGQIASYAWGADYHDVLPGRLRAIIAYIEGQTGEPIPNRWYTDTGPILERGLAQRAGLGWIGKNACLINPQMGSYFLLAEILLGIELEVDEPFTPDHCGSCTRCLDYCPTACITEDRTIDANQCISYLTIEHKGFIPKNMRPKLGDWVFGCDVCQQVCPWNQKFVPSDHDPEFSPRPGVPPISLVEELSLSPQEFNRKFRGSPIKRTKRRGYLRNIAIALGNIGDPDAVQGLISALDDVEPLVRGHTAWALGEIGGKDAENGLKAFFKSESNLEVISEIQTALNAIQKER